MIKHTRSLLARLRGLLQDGYRLSRINLVSIRSGGIYPAHLLLMSPLVLVDESHRIVTDDELNTTMDLRIERADS